MINKYFINCRGVTFNKVHSSEWDNSGGLPRVTSPFLPYTSNFNEEMMTFAGSTKTSNWLHWDATEAANQLDALQGIGVNLIRVYGDMFCWAAFPDRYLAAVESLTSLCNDRKLYMQWVLFDGFTDEDSASTNHELGYFDPSTTFESVSWGIKRWQRCPNINENDLSNTEDYYNHSFGLPTRSPSSLTASGDSYITDMVATAGKYRATLAWEVMHDINILSTESSGYDFLVAAIGKVNSLKHERQKVTFSAKNLNARSAPLEPGGSQFPDTYNSSIVEILTPLVDFVCELTTNFTTHGFINSYLRLRNFSSSTGKPVMLLDSFNYSLMTPFDLYNFSKDFRIGVICEGMIDRSFTRKPNNSTKGILYDDGSSRRILDASSVGNKAKIDGRGNFNAPIEKTTFDTLSGVLEASSFPRFSAFEETGNVSWSAIYTASRSFPEYSAIPIGYAPMASSTSSTFGQWGVVGDVESYQNSSVFSVIQSIRSGLLATPLSSSMGDWVTDVNRDVFGHKILTKLIKLTEDLDMHKGHNYYNTTNYATLESSGYLDVSYQESLFSSASAFMPRSVTKTDDYNSSPFIASPKYFSSIAVSEGAYRDNPNYFQKPLCYWVRDDDNLSGSCYYLDVPVDTASLDITEVDIIGSYIDWQAYDIALINWADNLYNAYVNMNKNLQQYLLIHLGEQRVSMYLQDQEYLS
jgi:hypothetical protein